MNPAMRTTVFGLAFALCAMPAAAQLYKWVDEKGVTHYGERPPSDKAKAFTPRDATGGASTPSQKADPNLRRQEREFQTRQRKRDREAEAAQRAQQRRNTPAAERARAADCRRANRDMAIIRGNPSSHTFAEEARVRDSIARHCS